MIIVTGGAGFIGSNLIASLNRRGHSDILLVDNLKNPAKLPNLVDLELADYLHKYDFLQLLEKNELGPDNIEAVFHLGACSDTTEQDGDYMMDNNYACTRALFTYCRQHKLRLLYASSAAVYGASTNFCEERANEQPLNIYGYSKFLFDQYARRNWHDQAQLVGLRYFNVYGPREGHKGKMASVASHHYRQLHERGYVELFVGSHGYANGEQQRDFVYVQDVVDAKLHFLDNPQESGIFNLGTGKAQSFNQLSLASVRAWTGKPDLGLTQAVDTGLIRYVHFPPGLQARYQAYTQADITKLRDTGFYQPMRPVEQGVAKYYAWLHETT